MVELKVGSLNETTEQVSATVVEQTVKYNPKDPYDTPEERAEGMFVGKFIGRLTGEPDGFCSTYREWHIFWRGIYSGFKTVLTGKFEPCPDMWTDEAQYYEAGQEIGYVARNAFIFILTGSIGTEVVINSSTILSVIGKVLGV